jgi:hypothetical protein
MSEPGLVFAGAILALLVLLAEWVWLWRMAQRGDAKALPRLTILLIVAAGAGLILALILAMLGAEARWSGLALAFAGLAHGWDLLRRLNRQDR